MSKLMKRKPIQIAIAATHSEESAYDHVYRFVLCDDGTLWRSDYGNWEQMRDIPQPEDEEQEAANDS